MKIGKKNADAVNKKEKRVMARNNWARPFCQCGKMVQPKTGHFERYAGGWRVKHANHPGDGRVTCAMATAEIERERGR